MNRHRETRICPVCHCLLWEEDFLHPRDLETWQGSPEDPVLAFETGLDAPDLDDVIELLVEVLLAQGLESVLKTLPTPKITIVLETPSVGAERNPR